MPTKRALLIGIDAYPHVTPLRGCVNDVRLMQSVLVETFGFPVGGLTVLIDQQATREAILAALDALVAATGPDDIVVIQYAGHGSQMADREGDEPSGFDSTLVPYDASRSEADGTGGDVPDITDDEIRLRLEGLAAKTPFTTLVVDACHSGTITRDDFGERARSIPRDARPAAALPPSPIPEDRREGAREAGPSGWMPLADRYVLIAGCRDEERSYEYRPAGGGGAIVHGALTYFLCQQLRQATATATYRDVFERTAALVNAANAIQHPQLEGRIDRVVFGMTEIVTAPYARVLEREDDHVLLAAGAAHGATAGSTYRVFPQGTPRPESAELGEVEIVGVQAVTAAARVVREAVPGGIVPDARAFERVHAFAAPVLRVAVSAPEALATEAAALRATLLGSPFLVLVDEVGTADVCVYGLAPRAQVLPATPVPQAGIVGEPRWAAIGTTGDVLMPLKRLDDLGTVADNLATIARHRQALAIENPDPFSRLRGRFSVVLQRLGEDRRTWTDAVPASGGGTLAFEEGDVVRVVVRSRHDAPVFVSLYDFGITGRIAPIYPPRGAQEMLRAHGEFACEAQRLGFPEGFPFVDSVDHAREGAALETVKLFVTEQPTDFSAFSQEAVRGEGSTPLARLLSTTFRGRATRDMAPVALGDEDWTTVAAPFLLRRRTSVLLPATATEVTMGTMAVQASGLAGTISAGFGPKGRLQDAATITDALGQALAGAGVDTRQTIRITHAQEVGPATRGIGDQPAIEVRVAEPPDGHGQMVLAADELGVLSWCFQVPPTPRPATRGLAKKITGRTYLVPRAVPARAGAGEPAGSRGLVGLVGSKIVKELVFPLVHPILGELSAAFINRLEHQRWPYRLRTFTPDDYALDAAAAIDRDGWTRLGSGRALLFVHGTFSRGHLAFARWPKAEVEALHRLYEGRVFAFDHLTLSHDPTENVRWLVSQLPDAADLSLDIVCHSRGGLVSRLLAEKQAELSLGSRRVRVGKVIFVGSPSAGTALADPEHVATVLDVFTNLMNFLPDNGITEVMTMIVEVAKLVAVGTIGGLPGLQAMRPGGAYATWLNAGGRAGDTRYFAVASDVSPSEPGLRHLVLTHGLDRLLRGANDYVVPAESVFAANGSGFFPIDDRLVLEGTDAVAHTTYFADPRVRGRIVEWLTA